MCEDVSKQARVGLYHIVAQFFDELDKKDSEASLKLYQNICIALRIPRDRRVIYFYQASKETENLINTCDWWQFYDICEVVWQCLFLSNYSNDQREFEIQINELFREEHLGFEMRKGKVEKVGSGFIDVKIKEVRYLLKEPEFKSADELFEKAIKALNERPNPDVENCIKDAVAAIESVGRIIFGDDNALLDNIVKNAVRKGVIPQPLDQTITKLYAYRGNEPAVAHGGTEPSKVTVNEAEFVLAMSAAMIIYIVKKRSQLV
jgi:hypothetical protein